MGTVRIEDIQKRLEECESPDVADHFYSFGQFLLGEALRQMEAHHEQQLRVEVLRRAVLVRCKAFGASHPIAR